LVAGTQDDRLHLGTVAHRHHHFLENVGRLRGCGRRRRRLGAAGDNGRGGDKYKGGAKGERGADRFQILHENLRDWMPGISADGRAEVNRGIGNGMGPPGPYRSNIKAGMALIRT
jgi:hypothetical protein